MKILSLLTALLALLSGCVPPTQANSGIFEFDKWFHINYADERIDLVVNKEIQDFSIIFIVDPKIGCDARMVFTSDQFQTEDFAPLNGQLFDWQMANREYTGDSASRLNVDGYVRFELMSFYKHHFDQLESLLATEGQINFKMSDPKGLFEQQEFHWPAAGLSGALDHALDTCQGWT